MHITTPRRGSILRWRFLGYQFNSAILCGEVRVVRSYVLHLNFPLRAIGLAAPISGYDLFRLLQYEGFLEVRV